MFPSAYAPIGGLCSGTIDPATEVLSEDLLAVHRGRVRPSFYSDADLAALVGAARELRPAWRAVTYETLVGLLAVSGLRLGEALGLDRGDVDLDAGVLVVRRAKSSGAREVALHKTTTDALGCIALGFVEAPAVGFDALYWSFVPPAIMLPKRC